MRFGQHTQPIASRVDAPIPSSESSVQPHPVHQHNEKFSPFSSDLTPISSTRENTGSASTVAAAATSGSAPTAAVYSAAKQHEISVENPGEASNSQDLPNSFQASIRELVECGHMEALVDAVRRPALLSQIRGSPHSQAAITNSIIHACYLRGLEGISIPPHCTLDTFMPGTVQLPPKPVSPSSWAALGARSTQLLATASLAASTTQDPALLQGLWGYFDSALTSPVLGAQQPQDSFVLSLWSLAPLVSSAPSYQPAQPIPGQGTATGTPFDDVSPPTLPITSHVAMSMLRHAVRGRTRGFSNQVDIPSIAAVCTASQYLGADMARAASTLLRQTVEQVTSAIRQSDLNAAGAWRGRTGSQRGRAMELQSGSTAKTTPYSPVSTSWQSNLPLIPGGSDRPQPSSGTGTNSAKARLDAASAQIPLEGGPDSHMLNRMDVLSLVTALGVAGMTDEMRELLVHVGAMEWGVAMDQGLRETVYTAYLMAGDMVQALAVNGSMSYTQSHALCSHAALNKQSEPSSLGQGQGQAQGQGSNVDLRHAVCGALRSLQLSSGDLTPYLGFDSSLLGRSLLVCCLVQERQPVRALSLLEYMIARKALPLPEAVTGVLETLSVLHPALLHDPAATASLARRLGSQLPWDHASPAASPPSKPSATPAVAWDTSDMTASTTNRAVRSLMHRVERLIEGLQLLGFVPRPADINALIRMYGRVGQVGQSMELGWSILMPWADKEYGLQTGLWRPNFGDRRAVLRLWGGGVQLKGGVLDETGGTGPGQSTGRSMKSPSALSREVNNRRGAEGGDVRVRPTVDTIHALLFAMADSVPALYKERMIHRRQLASLQQLSLACGFASTAISNQLMDQVQARLGHPNRWHVDWFRNLPVLPPRSGTVLQCAVRGGVGVWCPMEQAAFLEFATMRKHVKASRPAAAAADTSTASGLALPLLSDLKTVLAQWERDSASPDLQTHLTQLWIERQPSSVPANSLQLPAEAEVGWWGELAPTHVTGGAVSRVGSAPQLRQEIAKAWDQLDEVQAACAAVEVPSPSKSLLQTERRLMRELADSVFAPPGRSAQRLVAWDMEATQAALDRQRVELSALMDRSENLEHATMFMSHLTSVQACLNDERTLQAHISRLDGVWAADVEPALDQLQRTRLHSITKPKKTVLPHVEWDESNMHEATRSALHTTQRLLLLLGCEPDGDDRVLAQQLLRAGMTHADLQYAALLLARRLATHRASRYHVWQHSVGATAHRMQAPLEAMKARVADMRAASMRVWRENMVLQQAVTDDSTLLERQVVEAAVLRSAVSRVKAAPNRSPYEETARRLDLQALHARATQARQRLRATQTHRTRLETNRMREDGQRRLAEVRSEIDAEIQAVWDGVAAARRIDRRPVAVGAQRAKLVEAEAAQRRAAVCRAHLEERVADLEAQLRLAQERLAMMTGGDHSMSAPAEPYDAGHVGAESDSGGEVAAALGDAVEALRLQDADVGQEQVEAVLEAGRGSWSVEGCEAAVRVLADTIHQLTGDMIPLSWSVEPVSSPVYSARSSVAGAGDGSPGSDQRSHRGSLASSQRTRSHIPVVEQSYEASHNHLRGYRYFAAQSAVASHRSSGRRASRVGGRRVRGEGRTARGKMASSSLRPQDP